MEGQTFVFFGIVGSGKGTQVKLLQEFLTENGGKECVYIGTGEIFRKIAQSESEGNEAAKAVKELINAGSLVPDKETNDLVSESVKTEWSPGKILFFDGYPRTLAQSRFFEQMMDSYKIKNIQIIYIAVGREEATKRNLLRGRHDDTKEGLEKRFDEYVNNVIPAMNYFKDREGYEILTIKGEQSVEDVHKDIIKALNL